MWANDPEMAEKWEKEEEKNEGRIMKLTQHQLRRIIREAILKEGLDEAFAPSERDQERYDLDWKGQPQGDHPFAQGDDEKWTMSELKDAVADAVTTKSSIGRQATGISVREDKNFQVEWDTEYAFKVTIKGSMGQKEQWQAVGNIETGEVQIVGRV